MPDIVQRRNRLSFLRGNIRLLSVLGLVIIIGIAATFFIFENKSQKPAANPTVKIGKSYTIIGRLQDRRATTGDLTLTVTDAQITNSILVQGKVARPVKGKLFLVVNMEIENPFKAILYVFPVDLFRFVRGDGKKLAPSVHQGTVQIRPQATKKSNIAFVISPGDKKFKVEVGEIFKEREILEITFR